MDNSIPNNLQVCHACKCNLVVNEKTFFRFTMQKVRATELSWVYESADKLQTIHVCEECVNTAQEEF